MDMPFYKMMVTIPLIANSIQGCESFQRGKFMNRCLIQGNFLYRNLITLVTQLNILTLATQLKHTDTSNTAESLKHTDTSNTAETY